VRAGDERGGREQACGPILGHSEQCCVGVAAPVLEEAGEGGCVARPGEGERQPVRSSGAHRRRLRGPKPFDQRVPGVPVLDEHEPGQRPPGPGLRTEDAVGPHRGVLVGQRRLRRRFPSSWPPAQPPLPGGAATADVVWNHACQPVAEPATEASSVATSRSTASGSSVLSPAARVFSIDAAAARNAVTEVELGFVVLAAGAGVWSSERWAGTGVPASAASAASADRRGPPPGAGYSTGCHAGQRIRRREADDDGGEHELRYEPPLVEVALLVRQVEGGVDDSSTEEEAGRRPGQSSPAQPDRADRQRRDDRQTGRAGEEPPVRDRVGGRGQLEEEGDAAGPHPTRRGDQPGRADHGRPADHREAPPPAPPHHHQREQEDDVLLGGQRDRQRQHRPGRVAADDEGDGEQHEPDQQAVRPRLLHDAERRRRHQRERDDREDRRGQLQEGLRGRPHLRGRPPTDGDQQREPADEEHREFTPPHVAHEPARRAEEETARQVGEALGGLAARCLREGERVRIAAGEEAARRVLQQHPDVDPRTATAGHDRCESHDRGDESRPADPVRGRAGSPQRDPGENRRRREDRDTAPEEPPDADVGGQRADRHPDDAQHKHGGDHRADGRAGGCAHRRAGRATPADDGQDARRAERDGKGERARRQVPRTRAGQQTGARHQEGGPARSWHPDIVTDAGRRLRGIPRRRRAWLFTHGPRLPHRVFG